MDGRHRAQDRQRQVNRCPALVQLGEDRNRLGRDIGDDPERVTDVEFPGLGRNIGRRIAQVEEAADARSRGFRHDGAGTVVIEAIDHDPVEPGQCPHLTRAFAEQVGQATRLVQPRHHRADGAGGIAQRRRRRCLALQHDRVVDHVQREIIAAGAVDGGNLDAEHAFDRIGPAQQGQPVADGVDRLFAQMVGGMGAEQVVRRFAEHITDIGRYPLDQPVGGQRDQKPERLDRAQFVDRFPVAIGQIDIEVGFGHAYSFTRQFRPARSNRTKVSSAASMAVSVRPSS